MKKIRCSLEGTVWVIVCGSSPERGEFVMEVIFEKVDFKPGIKE